MGAGIFIIIPIVIAIFVIIAIFGYQQAKQRREALAGLAGQLGWQFDPSNDSSHDDEYAQFEIFRRGDRRQAYNTLWGSLVINARNCPAKAGDFTYKVASRSGKNRRTTTYHFSYLVVQLPFSHAPELLIRAEGLFDRLAGAFGFDDIDFESSEFSRAFHVKSSDKKFAYDVCHPRMMEFLMTTRPPMIDIERGQCCLSDGRGCWSPEQFQAHITWLHEFFEKWPDYLKSDLTQAQR